MNVLVFLKLLKASGLAKTVLRSKESDCLRQFLVKEEGEEECYQDIIVLTEKAVKEKCGRMEKKYKETLKNYRKYRTKDLI